MVQELIRRDNVIFYISSRTNQNVDSTNHWQYRNSKRI